MTDLISAIIQGVVEGLTEFLPVSSTAHIIIAQELMGLDRTDPFRKMFTVFIQLGAILAVVAYFWSRLTRFLGSFRDSIRNQSTTSGRSVWVSHPLALVMISFVVTAIPAVLLDKTIGDFLEGRLVYIGIALLVGGIAMYVIDHWASKRVTTEELEQVNLRQAVAIGIAQVAAAAFPGTSRSMSTIAGGQLMGLSRSVALEFSFFLSIPIMFAAAGFKLLQYLAKNPVPTGEQWLALGAGFVTSFLVALVVIAWFMGWVRKHGFTPFAIYRVITGIALIWWDCFR